MVNVDTRETCPLALVWIAGTAIVCGAVIGGSTNAINGAVSAEYFRQIMGWHDVEQIWRASIAQGIFEGLIYGIVFSVVFTAVVGLVSRARCSFAFAFQHLLRIVVAIYCCWAAGGLIAMGLATLSPDFYRSTFVGVPDQFAPMLRYAWVGGSIWGAMFGGFVCVVIGSILFAVRWRRTQSQEGT
ncbi:MAG: hypothetical protein D6724_07815 [Armatimonadetes bacterium]|nr:MAG: hypothetical protein D6724_07815 [Armatimonadota bacterium]